MAGSDTTIPPGDWESGRRLRPSAWSSPAGSSGDRILRTLRSAGDVAPDAFPPPWSLHLGLSETLGTPQVRMIANGFELFFAGMAEPAVIRCLMTPKGVWVGHASIELRPSLFSPEQEVHHERGYDQVACDGSTAALVYTTSDWDTRFSLCPGAATPDDARKEATDALEYPVDEAWSRECGLRSRFWSGLRDLPVDTALLNRSLETLVFHLGADPDGVRHSAPFVPAPPDLHLNHLFALVPAWLDIDEAIAAELLQDALGRIQPDGSLPALPGTPHSAWPLLAQTCQRFCRSATSPGIVESRLSDIERYLVAALDRYDADGSGLVCWPSSAEAFIPDTHDDNLASASLATFLLAELDALTELATLFPGTPVDTTELGVRRTRIQKHLTTTLWHPSDGVCHDRYVGGEPVARVTLSGLIPVGVRTLDATARVSLEQKASDPAFLAGPDGLQLWKEWENDPAPPPVPAAHQLLVLQMLEHGGIDAEWLEDRCLDAITRQLHAHGELPLDLHTGAIEPRDPHEPDWFESPTLPACLAIATSVPAARRQQEDLVPRWLVTLDQHRMTILTGVIAIFAGLLLVSVYNTYRPRVVREEPTTASVRLVRNLIAKQDYQGARESIDEIREHSRSTPPPALDFYEANLFFREGRYAKARELYEKCVNENVEAIKASMNLGLTFYREGRPEEAKDQYRRVLERYGDNEMVADLASTAISIVSRFPTPPETEEK